MDCLDGQYHSENRWWNDKMEWDKQPQRAVFLFIGGGFKSTKIKKCKTNSHCRRHGLWCLRPMRTVPLCRRTGRTPPSTPRSLHRCFPRRSLESGTLKAGLYGGARLLPVHSLLLSECHGGRPLGRGWGRLEATLPRSPYTRSPSWWLHWWWGRACGTARRVLWSTK